MFFGVYPMSMLMPIWCIVFVITGKWVISWYLDKLHDLGEQTWKETPL